MLLIAGLAACDQQGGELVAPQANRSPAALASGAPTQGALLGQIRGATARYHRVEVALADGYVRIPFPCVPGEGIRYARFDLYDGVVDPSMPEQLLYEPLPSGGLRLAAVGYIVPSGAWDPFHSGPPMLGEQPFMDRRSPPFGAPFPNYALFVWVWKHNPQGMYTLVNPKLTC